MLCINVEFLLKTLKRDNKDLSHKSPSDTTERQFQGSVKTVFKNL